MKWRALLAESSHQGAWSVSMKYWYYIAAAEGELEVCGKFSITVIHRGTGSLKYSDVSFVFVPLKICTLCWNSVLNFYLFFMEVHIQRKKSRTLTWFYPSLIDWIMKSGYYTQASLLKGIGDKKEDTKFK